MPASCKLRSRSAVVTRRHTCGVCMCVWGDQIQFLVATDFPHVLASMKHWQARQGAGHNRAPPIPSLGHLTSQPGDTRAGSGSMLHDTRWRAWSAQPAASARRRRSTTFGIGASVGGDGGIAAPPAASGPLCGWRACWQLKRGCRPRRECYEARRGCDTRRRSGTGIGSGSGTGAHESEAGMPWVASLHHAAVRACGLGIRTVSREEEAVVPARRLCGAADGPEQRLPACCAPPGSCPCPGDTPCLCASSPS